MSGGRAEGACLGIGAAYAAGREAPLQRIASDGGSRQPDRHARSRTISGD